MIVMNLELDNLMGFNGFKMNFSYPKKIVNSSIPNEFLLNKTNFRYKKLNVLIGANASGKTSIGKALMIIFNFISKRDSAKIKELVRNEKEKSQFSIDFLIDENTLYRVNCEIGEELDGVSSKDRRFESDPYIKVEVYTASIGKNDSYESCVKKLKQVSVNINDEKTDEAITQSIVNSDYDFIMLIDIESNSFSMFRRSSSCFS